jgi:hypothetical protein
MCANAGSPKLGVFFFGGRETAECVLLRGICFAVRQSLVGVVSLHLSAPIAFQNIEDLSALVGIQIRECAS